MRRALVLATVSVLVVSGCQESETAPMAEQAAESAPTTVEDAATSGAIAPSARSVTSDAVPRPQPTPPAPIAQIAYAYRYALSLPRDRGAEVMSRHELACVSAGPGLCQVVSAAADWTAREPGGRLELRGQPDWINRFRSGLALDAQNAGGRLDEAETVGEDVTRGMDMVATGIKTEASLAERIRELQNRRGGTLEERLAIERQLAELQRSLDAQRIELRALNDRVQSARLTLAYRPGGVFAADNPTRPVAQALRDAFGLSMGMVALLITTSSVLLPVVAIGGLVWLAVRRRRPGPAAA